MTTINPAVLAAIAAAKLNEDQSKVVAGGSYAPPAAGRCFARLVSYLELGEEKYDYKGTPKTKNRVRLVFELFGAKHPVAEVTVDGVTTKIPVRVTLNINKSFGENGAWRKLFAKLNWNGDITHAAEAVGRAFAVTIVHNKVEEGTPKEKVFANLTDADGVFLIEPPRKRLADDDDGQEVWVPVEVPQPLTEPKVFLWDYCDKAQWDSIYIAGTYPEKKDAAGKVTAPAKSKNSIQETIKQASNYIGSPIYNLLAANGDDLNIPEDEQPVRNEEAQQASVEQKAGAEASAGASEDPLAGV